MTLPGRASRARRTPGSRSRDRNVRFRRSRTRAGRRARHAVAERSPRRRCDRPESTARRSWIGRALARRCVAETSSHRIVARRSGRRPSCSPSDGEPGSLTSDSTRRPGVVTSVDVAPTIAAFLGRRSASRSDRCRRSGSSTGRRRSSSTSATSRSGACTSRSERRRRSTSRSAALARSRSSPSAPRAEPGVRRIARLVGVLRADARGRAARGRSPARALVRDRGPDGRDRDRVRHAGVLAARTPRRRPLVPVGIGLAVLAFFALEALLGWPGMITPLLGGSQLDGGRFYGLPNVAIGVLIGAVSGSPIALPNGARVRLAVRARAVRRAPVPRRRTSAAACRCSPRPACGSRSANGTGSASGEGIGAVVAVTAARRPRVILVAHAISPLETHVSRFEENVERHRRRGRTFVDRLQVGFDLIARNPLALIPVIGLRRVAGRRPAPSRAAPPERSSAAPRGATRSSSRCSRAWSPTSRTTRGRRRRASRSARARRAAGGVAAARSREDGEPMSTEPTVPPRPDHLHPVPAAPPPPEPDAPRRAGGDVELGRGRRRLRGRVPDRRHASPSRSSTLFEDDTDLANMSATAVAALVIVGHPDRVADDVPPRLGPR